MACFAVHAGMTAGFLQVRHVAMTRLTLLVSGMNHRQRGHIFDGVRAIVAIQAEGSGNKEPAHDGEDKNPAQENRSHANQVFGILHN
jgi:hypothetical protein